MKKLLLLAGLSLGFGLAAQASHLMGGQITVSHDTLSAYTVHLTLYRDMAGIPMTAPTIHVIDTVAHTDVVVTPTLTLLDTVGGASAVYGVEEYTYEAPLTLTAGQYLITWSDCCRNAAIRNGVANESMYLKTELTVPAAFDNSTPVFLNQPIAFVPLNTPWAYNPLPYDADGDSLVWYLDTPQGNAAMSTPDLGSPLTHWTLPTGVSGGGYALNPITGEVTWTADTIGNYVTSFVVDEYRNGVKIGTIRRDMQMIVSAINNSAPLLAGVSTLPRDAHGNIIVTVEESDNFRLTVTANDTEHDRIMLTAKGEPFILKTNPATFTVSSVSTGTQGIFDWTPNNAQKRTRPYVIAIRATDVNNSISFSMDNTLMFQIVTKTSTGINAPAAVAIQNIYPNPTADRLYVPFNLVNAGKVNIDAVDMAGRTVATLYNGTMPAGTQLANLAHNLDNGAYMLRISANGSVATKAFTVVR